MTETETKTEEPVTVEEPEKLGDEILRKLIEVVGEKNVSNTELERIVYSGDPSALPQFHYRWKRRYLADYVVRVDNVQQVKDVIAIASSHKMPVIPRGGASSCLGSSSPSRGGISLDIKRMNRILEISDKSENEMFVRVEPGVTFMQLETELLKKGLELGIYPTSAKSAVIGGWIGCGGKAGVGTPYYGTLLDNLEEIKVILPDGRLEIDQGKDIELYNGSYGILGVIVEAKLRIRPSPVTVRTMSFGFAYLEQVCNAMVQISKLETKPLYLKIADEKFQSYSNPLEKGRYVLTVTYIEDTVAAPMTEISEIVSESGGASAGDTYASKEWELRYDCEFNPKEHTHTLMFQELWVEVDRVYDILTAFEKTKKTHKNPSLWYGMLGGNSMMRLELLAMLNPDRYLEFISSKGILHKMMKRAIRHGGGPYTIGLQNSIYMKKAYRQRLDQMKEAKARLDPSNIMNPDRVTSCMTSYGRINVLFGLAAAFRRLAKFVAR